MLLGFKPHFAELIKNGRKIHTIREGNRFKVGDKLHMYTGVRTKNCQKIDIEGWPLEVKWVMKVELKFTGDYFVLLQYSNHYQSLSTIEMDNLALNDGFENWFDMYKWFRANYPKEACFKGQIIGWTDAAYRLPAWPDVRMC